jgi:hypothetical protein
MDPKIRFTALPILEWNINNERHHSLITLRSKGVEVVRAQCNQNVT